MIKQYQLSKSAYARRSAAISKIPNFWPLVIEASPPELDSFVHPQDSKIFAESLTSIEITRPEIDSSASASASAAPKGEFKGHPRSFQITFTFSPNAYFSNSTLTKTFHYRRASDGWCNLVSEPVRIDWKNPEQDLSEGLTDAAYALFHARKNASTTTSTSTGGGGAGDDPTSLSMQQKSLPEYSHLLTLLTSKNGHNTSFFTWFGFVSSRRWVSAEESEKAWEEFYGKLEAVRKGEKVSLVAAKDGDKDDEDDENEEDDDDEEEYGDQAVEVFENGDDVAAVLAEEIWPNAIKYFTQAQEMSESDGLSYDEDDDDEVESEDGEEEEEVDMQALVAEANNKKTEKKKKRLSDVGFPSKKQKN